MNYVQQREAELKQRYQIEVWWARIANLWNTVANVMKLENDMAVLNQEYSKIRSQYIRKGRKVGYSPKKITA